MPTQLQALEGAASPHPEFLSRVCAAQMKALEGESILKDKL